MNIDRRIVIGITSTMALVAALWYILVPAEAPMATAGSQANFPANAAGFLPVAQDAPHAIATASEVNPDEEGKGWFATDTASTASARYHAMRDKRRFFDLALKTGGGAYLAFAMLAEMRCSRANGHPGAIAELKRRSESGDELASYHKAILPSLDGCAGFETRPTGASDMLSMMTTFMGASDPAARAMRLMREEDPEVIRREVGALLREGDPVLVALLVDAMAKIAIEPAKGGAAGNGPATIVRSSTQAEANEEDSAWTLALCRLGIECSKYDSPPWFNACPNMGNCGDRFAESLAREVHQARFDAVLARSEVVEKAIRDRNWRSLGF